MPHFFKKNKKPFFLFSLFLAKKFLVYDDIHDKQITYIHTVYFVFKVWIISKCVPPFNHIYSVLKTVFSIIRFYMFLLHICVVIIYQFGIKHKFTTLGIVRGGFSLRLVIGSLSRAIPFERHS